MAGIATAPSFGQRATPVSRVTVMVIGPGANSRIQ